MELSELIAQNLEDNRSKLVNLGLFLDNKGGEGGLEDGTNYVFVAASGTHYDNAAKLQAAYDKAVNMPRYLGELHVSTPLLYKKGQTFLLTGDGTPSYQRVEISVNVPTPANGVVKSPITEIEAKSERVTVICTPGIYDFSDTPFTMDAESVDLCSLTGQTDVILTSLDNHGIGVNADNIRVTGVSTGNKAFKILDNFPNNVYTRCTGGSNSFGFQVSDSGTYIDCIGGACSFSGGSSYGVDASGTYIDCIGGNYSFGGTAGGIPGTASGRFIRCTGGNGCFAGSGGGGASQGGTISGTLTYCTGGAYSFGGSSYGDGSVTSNARLYYCKLIVGTFIVPEVGGKLVLCIDGSDSVITTID